MNITAAPSNTFGRSSEQGVALQLLERAVRSEGGILILEGEPGVGKTHLLRWWRDAAEQAGLNVMAASGRELEQDRPFGLLIDALELSPDSTDPQRAAAGRLMAAPTEALDAGIFGGFQDRRYIAVEAVTGLIERLASAAPLALILDDLQWSDASTIVTLGRVLGLSATLPIVVLCGLRPLPRSEGLRALLRAPGTERAARVFLGPLPDLSVGELVAHLAGARPGPRIMGQALRCGGNPLFVTALIESLHREQMLQRTAEGVDLSGEAASGPPPGLSMLVLRHLSMLPAETIDLIRTATVLGSTFSVGDLSLVTGRRATDLLALLGPALGAGLLVGVDGGLAFQHDLVRDAVYDDLDESLKRALHREAGISLAAAFAPTRQIAFHFAAGAAAGDQNAAAWLLRAGGEAAVRDPVAAVNLLEKAVAIAGPASELDQTIHLTLGQALAAAGRLSDAEEILRSLAARSDDPSTAAEARAALGQVLHLQARFREGAVELAAAAASPKLPPALRARLLAHSIMDRAWSGDRENVDVEAQAALEAGKRIGDRLTRFYAVMALIDVTRAHGWLSRAMELTLEAGRIVTAISSDDEITHYEMPPVGSLIDGDRLDEAESILTSAPAWCEERGGAVQPMRHHRLMRCHLLRGDWDSAVVEGETALLLARESGTTWGVDSTKALLSLMLARQDKLARALSYLADLEGTDARSSQEAEVLLAHVEVSAAEGDDGRIASVLGSYRAAVMDLSRPIYWLRDWGARLVQLYLAIEDGAAAISLTQQIEALAERAEVASVRGLAMLSRGMVEENGAQLLAAVDVLRDTPRAVDLAMAYEVAGTAIRSPVLMGQALDLYQRFGARRDAARAIRSLRALGVRLGQRGVRSRPSTGWASLTPAERRVAELVSEGLLYKEIGARLFVSRRTVETHVTHLFAKLGIASRIELARMVRQRVGENPQ
jgi:DNA-binding CsgD family transcriptional regulator